MSEWIRIPAEIPADADRRSLAGIFTAVELEVRIVKVQLTKGGSVRKFMEYRAQEKEKAEI